MSMIVGAVRTQRTKWIRNMQMEDDNVKRWKKMEVEWEGSRNMDVIRKKIRWVEWYERREKIVKSFVIVPLCHSRYSYEGITDTKILTVTHMCTCVSPFYTFPYHPDCKWSLWEQRMRPLPKYQFNKEQFALSPSLSPAHSLFFPFCEREKNDVSLSVLFKLHCSNFGFMSAVQRLMAAS